MATVFVNFNDHAGNSHEADFVPTSNLVSDITEYGEAWASNNDSELKDWEVVASDLDYNNQAEYDEFSNLDEFGEYCEEVDNCGEAYCLRYADIGDHDFDDEYNGCWDCEEDFTRDLFEACNDIPESMKYYIDWDAVNRDYIADYSVYCGDNGQVHIFRN